MSRASVVEKLDKQDFIEKNKSPRSNRFSVGPKDTLLERSSVGRAIFLRLTPNKPMWPPETIVPQI